MTRRTLLSLALTLFAVAAQAAPIYTDRIIAVVNEEVITLFDVKSYTIPMQVQLRRQFEQDRDVEKYRASLNKLTADATQALIDQEVLHAEFERRGHQVPPELVDAQIDQMVVKAAGGDYEQFLKILDSQGVTMSAIRRQVEKRVAVNMLTETMVNSRVIITPSDIERYYQDNPDQFRKPGRLHMHHLAIQQADMSDDDFAQLIAGIRNDLVTGNGDLAAAAKRHEKYSQFKDRGWEDEAQLGDALDRVLPNRSIGSISRWSVQESQGKKIAVLLKVVDAESAGQEPLTDDVRKTIKKRLEFEEQRSKSDELLKRLRANAYIRIHAKDIIPDAPAAPVEASN